MADVDEVIKRGEILFWPELPYYVTYEVKSHHADFTAYEVFVMCDKNGVLSMKDGMPPLFESGFGSDPVWRIEEAEVYLRGFVKWDGCSNWDFKTNPVMKHFCGRDDFVFVSRLLEKMWDIAAKEIPAWND